MENCWVKTTTKPPQSTFTLSVPTTYSESLLTAHPLVKPLPTLRSRAFPTLPVSVPTEGESNSLVADEPVSRARTVEGFGAPSARGRTRERRANERPARETPAEAPSPCPAAARRLALHRPGCPGGRMRAALPGVPATLPPPTPRACHFLPSPHLRPGSVSRSLSLRESLCFPFLPAPRR